MQDIHNIRPPVQVGIDPAMIKLSVMAVAAVFLLALLVFLLRKYFKKRQHPGNLKRLPAPLAPFAAAQKELDRLVQVQGLDSRLFYFDLTAVLRRYIGRSFSSTAIEMTSQEFIRHINRLEIEPPLKKEIVGFQRGADPFKYAGRVPAQDQVMQDLERVRQVIAQIEKGRAEQVDIKEAVH